MIPRPSPMLATKRLLLRPHQLIDFDGYSALWAGAPEGNRNPLQQSPLGNLTEEEAWARLLRFIGHWEAFGYGPFIALEDGSSSIIAEAGFARFQRGVSQTFNSAPEAMWKVDDRHQGNGIASEAMLNITHWFDTQRPESRTVCMIHDTNTASQRVAGRLGFQPFGHANYRGKPVLLFERTRPSNG